MSSELFGVQNSIWQRNIAQSLSSYNVSWSKNDVILEKALSEFLSGANFDNALKPSTVQGGAKSLSLYNSDELLQGWQGLVEKSLKDNDAELNAVLNQIRHTTDIDQVLSSDFMAHSLVAGKTNAYQSAIGLSSSPSMPWQVGLNNENVWQSGEQVRNLAIGNKTVHQYTKESQNFAIGNQSVFQKGENNINVAISNDSVVQDTVDSENLAIGNDSVYQGGGRNQNTAYGNRIVFQEGMHNKNLAVKNGYVFQGGQYNQNLATGNDTVVQLGSRNFNTAKQSKNVLQGGENNINRIYTAQSAVQVGKNNSNYAQFVEKLMQSGTLNQNQARQVASIVLAGYRNSNHISDLTSSGTISGKLNFSAISAQKNAEVTLEGTANKNNISARDVKEGLAKVNVSGNRNSNVIHDARNVEINGENNQNTINTSKTGSASSVNVLGNANQARITGSTNVQIGGKANGVGVYSNDKDMNITAGGIGNVAVINAGTGDDIIRLAQGENNKFHINLNVGNDKVVVDKDAKGEIFINGSKRNSTHKVGAKLNARGQYSEKDTIKKNNVVELVGSSDDYNVETKQVKMSKKEYIQLQKKLSTSKMVEEEYAKGYKGNTETYKAYTRKSDGTVIYIKDVNKVEFVGSSPSAKATETAKAQPKSEKSDIAVDPKVTTKSAEKNSNKSKKETKSTETKSAKVADKKVEVKSSSKK